MTGIDCPRRPVKPWSSLPGVGYGNGLCNFVLVTLEVCDRHGLTLRTG